MGEGSQRTVTKTARDAGWRRAAKPRLNLHETTHLAGDESPIVGVQACVDLGMDPLMFGGTVSRAPAMTTEL